MVAYSERLRYRLGKRLARMPRPPTTRVLLGFQVATLSTDSAQFTFPDHPEITCRLLDQDRTLFVDTREIVIPPTTPLAAGSTTIECSTAAEPLLDEQYSQSHPCDGFAEVEVSDNLFTPLHQKRTDGKRFTSTATASDGVLSPTMGCPGAKVGRVDGYRKSFTEAKIGTSRISRRGPDVWDLILPLLQPPIDVGFIDVLDLPPSCAPYPYQWEGIKFLVERTSALLGDDMGTGKTVQSTLAARLLFQRGTISKALIVCPLSVLAQWDREVEKWAPALKTTVVRGSAVHRGTCWAMPAHVWITTYDTLRQDLDTLVRGENDRFDLVIVDEAQRIKNRSTGIAQAVRGIASTVRWALTGTPIENRVSELASLFAFLKPGLFPAPDVPALYARDLIRPYFLRRRKEDVLKDLPPKEEFPVWLRLGDEQQRTYDRMEKERVVALHEQGGSITAQSIVTLIGELKKICNRDPVTGSSAKYDWLKENLPDICESGDKVLIFSQYRQDRFGGTDWLTAELAEYGTLNYGDADTDRKRADTLRAFEADAGKRVFLGHPRTAGLGLNQLVAANYVVHFDHWWNPQVTNQATARAHRPNQTKKVFVYHLWVEDTIEEMILQKAVRKQSLYDEVIDSLAVETTENELFEIYDDLLMKHGFRALVSDHPMRGTQPNLAAQRRAPDIDAREFELMVGRLFTAMGYATRVTQFSRDGGVDVVARRESGSSILKLAIQCKCQTSPVGRPALQQLLGVVSADPSYSSGILVTNADASRDALDLVRTNGRVQIITGGQLKGLLQQYQVS